MSDEYISTTLNPGQTATAEAGTSPFASINKPSSAKLESTPRARFDSFAVFTETLDELLGLDDPIDSMSGTATAFNDSTGGSDGSDGETILKDLPAPEWDGLLHKAMRLLAPSAAPKQLEKKTTFDMSERPSTPVTNNTTTNKKRKKFARSNVDEALINHRAATAKRARTNGRFKQCEIVWVNVSPMGEMIL